MTSVSKIFYIAGEEVISSLKQGISTVKKSISNLCKHPILSFKSGSKRATTSDLASNVTHDANEEKNTFYDFSDTRCSNNIQNYIIVKTHKNEMTKQAIQRAWEATQGDANIQEAVEKKKISAPEPINDLERSAVEPGGPAWKEVWAGRSVKEVATKYKLKQLESIKDLQVVGDARDRAAYDICYKDHAWKAVATRYKFTRPEIVALLQEMMIDGGCAWQAVRAGQKCSEVAKKYEITSPEMIERLEFVAMNNNGPAAIAVRRGEKTVPAIAEAFGIMSAKGIERLEYMAAHEGPALQKIRERHLVGGPPFLPSVLHEYGIRGTSATLYLENALIEHDPRITEALRKGEQTVPAIAKMFGMVCAESIERLENIAVRIGPAAQKVRDGAFMPDVLAQYGITPFSSAHLYLEGMAMADDSVVAKALRRGEKTIPQVIESSGFQFFASINRLEDIVIPTNNLEARAVLAGKKGIHRLLKRYTITSPERTESLKHLAENRSYQEYLRALWSMCKHFIKGASRKFAH